MKAFDLKTIKIMKKQDAAADLLIRLMQARAEWQLDLVGASLAEKAGRDMKPRNAIIMHLVEKYGWTIDYCKAMPTDDIWLALSGDLKDLKMPDLNELENFLDRQTAVLKQIANAP